MADILAPMVGKVVKINAGPGDSVTEPDAVITIEAMKLEMPVPAGASGTVKEIKVSEGDQVEADQVVAVIE